MRDLIKNKEYFQDYISEEYESLEFFKESIVGKELEERGQRNFDATIDKHLRNILIAKYSIGTDLTDLKEDFLTSVTALEKTWESDSMYVQMIWMLSIGILLKIEDKEFDRLVALEEKDSVNDYVVDYLIAYRKPGREIRSILKFPDPYQTIKKITMASKAEAEKLLKLYLTKEWYKGHSDSGWHGNHKSKHDTYFGYWSFESGAIVKIMGLDDSNFKDNQYYPYDLVHYKA